MLQELLTLLPQEVTGRGLTLLISGALVGLILWLSGARFSRSLITLAMVMMGALMGLQLPRWLGLTINPPVVAVGAALLLGLSGFLLHRWWVGVGLGLLMAAWAAAALWLISDPAEHWSWPAAPTLATIPAFAGELWYALPAGLSRLLPFACAAALVSGICAALLCHRLGIVLTYSLGGVSLLVGLGCAAVHFVRPQWLAHLPAQALVQLMLLLSMVMIGALVQWQFALPAAAGGGGAGKKNGSDDDED
jgi:hypothetical protein